MGFGMRLYLIGLVFITSFSVVSVDAQELRINEIMSSNSKTVLDEDGDSPDWIELHNPGQEYVNLKGYSLFDHTSRETPWTFPDYELPPEHYLLVFASDKDRVDIPLFWETVTDQGDDWRYIVPTTEPDSNWRNLGFDDTAWLSGSTGIGYGDNDDNTILDEGTLSVFLRKSFNIESKDFISECLLHVDYDDGFVAFLNGTEIARSGLADGLPAFDAIAESHEAAIYNNGQPERFEVTNYQELLKEGENVLSVQVHNTGVSSSDMTIIPILSFGTTVDKGASFSKYLSQSTTYFHTNFRLSSSGDSVFLMSPESVMIDTMIALEMASDISLGLASDNSNRILLFNEPTPGAKNSTVGYEPSDIVRDVSFSQAPGYYSAALQVALSSTDSDDQIYYTTDGSVPLATDTRYIEEISITENTVLRARVINGINLPGNTATASYLLNIDHDLPVISISANPYDFFDETDGMYVHGPIGSDEFPYFGSNFWQDWERPINIEMFEEDGALAFSARAGAKIFGAYSRGNDQKSLSIFFRDSYGDGPIKYQLFPEKDLDEYSSIVLRNSGNDWNNSMMRDGLLTSVFHESLDLQGFRPSVVYLNGAYWGIHNVREKVNEDFLANNNDIDRDDITILEFGGNPVVGSGDHYYAFINYVENNSMSVAANYTYVQTQMDIMNYIYYMTGNIFINNYDWPASNIKFWREDSPEGKWRWISYDRDAGFGIWDGGSYSENRLRIVTTPSDAWPAPSWSTQLLRSLLQNVSFKNLFINTYADQLNTSWRTEVIQASIDEKKGLIESEIIDHLDRWNNSYGFWQTNVDNYYVYARERPGYAFQHIIEEFDLAGDFEVIIDVSRSDRGSVRVNTVTPDSYPWSGTYLSEIPIVVEATPFPGYRFIGWEGMESSDEAKLEISTSSDIELKAIFEEIDSELNSLVINEINYSSSDKTNISDWVELYNKSTESINLSGWVIKDDDDSHTFEFPEGTKIDGNGYLVVCVDQANFVDSYSGSILHIGDLDFGLSSVSDCVRLYDDTGQLAEEVCYLGTAPWPETANGNGATLALKHPNYNIKLNGSWYAASNKGTPGMENGYVLAIKKTKIGANLQVFPNPVFEKTTIEFSLDRADEVDLAIYSLTGERLVGLVSSELGAGKHMVTWVPEPFMGSGIYFVRLETPRGRYISKLLMER